MQKQETKGKDKKKIGFLIKKILIPCQWTHLVEDKKIFLPPEL